MLPRNRMAAREAHDAIIIGSGPNGLSAAIALARQGLRVKVFEGNATVGGGTRTAELTLPGFRHDVCSSIYPFAAASPFFRTLPLEARGLRWIHPGAPLAHPLDDGTAAVLHRSIDDTAATFRDDRDARTYAPMIRPLVAAWEDLAIDILSPPLHRPRAWRVFAKFMWLGAKSGKRFAEVHFRDARARALFAGCAAHSILPLEKLPSGAFGLVLMLAGHAVGWPMAAGGAQAIPEALSSLLRSLGGEIETAHEVRSMRDLPGSKLYLFDTTPRQMLAIAGGELPPRYGARAMRFKPGPGIFKVDWALSAPVPWTAEECAAAGTVHLSGTLEETAESEGAPWEGRTASRPYVIFAQPSMFDSSRAPAGKHVAWAYCHVPNGSREDMTERIEAQVERFAPGFRDTILARHTMNCAQIEQYNPNYLGGDIGGGANNAMQLLARPVLSINPYATPNPRIFICSASTPPGAGVHGMCGFLAAMAALTRMKKRR
jgi:phytoene dehydrogenase-like protein